MVKKVVLASQEPLFSVFVELMSVQIKHFKIKSLASRCPAFAVSPLKMAFEAIFYSVKLKVSLLLSALTSKNERHSVPLPPHVSFLLTKVNLSLG